MRKALDENIRYSRETWARHSWFQTAFLYTEKIHYYYLYRFLKNRFKKAAIRGKRPVLVDIGFGSGYPIARIAGRTPVRTIGLDLIRETVDRYNRRKVRNSAAIRMDPEKKKLPLKTGTADFTACSHLLEHVRDDRALLSEIRRILKKDGLCFFNIPINEEKFRVPNHVRKYTPGRFDQLLRKSGFRIDESFTSDNFTLWVTALGLKKSAAARMLKKALIFFLSLFPVAWLEKLPFKKSQYVCFARKRPE